MCFCHGALSNIGIGILVDLKNSLGARDVQLSDTLPDRTGTGQGFSAGTFGLRLLREQFEHEFGRNGHVPFPYARQPAVAQLKR